MRAILILSALLLASIPRGPEVLLNDEPQLLIQSPNCLVAKEQADAIAIALGFSTASEHCGGLYTTAYLKGQTVPRVAIPQNLITYSDYTPPQVSPSPIPRAFEIPSTVPFAAASGDITAYIKLDALVLYLQPENLLETAFALEEGGIPRSDMTAEDSARSLLVRVRPITTQQILKVERIAATQQSVSSPFAARKIGFINDCNRVIASLSGLALTEARHRAGVMARAAGAGIGKVLAVADPGGNATDAVCDVGKDATLRQLAVAAQNDLEISKPIATSHLYATFVRSVSAAWQLELPKNDPAAYWPRSETLTEPFLAAGVRARGEAMIVNAVAPNRAAVLIPDWAYNEMARSPYGHSIRYFDLGSGALEPLVDLRAPSSDELKQSVSKLTNYLSEIAVKKGNLSNLWFLYSLDDCSMPIDTALYSATQRAIAAARGKPIRYLQMENLTTIGSASCSYEPATWDTWSQSGIPEDASTVATVISAY
jgi:hypothetical protein